MTIVAIGSQFLSIKRVPLVDGVSLKKVADAMAEVLASVVIQTSETPVSHRKQIRDVKANRRVKIDRHFLGK